MLNKGRKNLKMAERFVSFLLAFLAASLSWRGSWCSQIRTPFLERAELPLFENYCVCPFSLV